MEPYEYETLYELEGTYWWFKHLHNVLRDTVLDLGADKNSIILDAGCGTGQNLIHIRQHISKHSFGIDLSTMANHFWVQRELTQVCNGSINELPLKADTFDFVISIDVLESAGVDEAHAIGEMVRLTKPGGHILIVVPAYDWLLTPEHHQAVHAIRRYTPSRLQALMTGFPVLVHRSTFLFMPVFPGVAGYRLLKRLFRHPEFTAPRSELNTLPRPLNTLLLWIVSLERHLLRSMDLPFGSSILLVMQRKTSA